MEHVDRKADEINGWLLREGRFAETIGTLLASLAQRYTEAGVPLVRATTHIRTLHPEFRGVMHLWRRGEMLEEITPRHGIENTPSYKKSPVEWVTRSGEWLDRRIDAAATREIPMLGDLATQGFTHYLMVPMPFSSGIMNAMSLATDAPEGFRTHHIALFRATVKTLLLVLETKATRRTMSELLTTYVGLDPGARIIAGAVQRGDLQSIRAAIMLTDMRGFTTLSDEAPAPEVLDALNTYFDCVVPSVSAAGGEVLKFIGDGVLSVFPADAFPPHDAARLACAAAFEAGQAALTNLAAARPFATGPLRMGVALHWGEVAYGNVGSGHRLDFTAIGRDVNLVSRLEKLCGPLDRPLLMTEEFAGYLDAPVFEIGHFEFKGFRRHRAVFGLL
ncbi:MAG TPA: adenylate/guanylate cyclase domain-containing protein [Stellaceae bacterium]|nr:adenylate/guanylate cyclase domain-containing protein [Stellaceae bacterium]